MAGQKPAYHRHRREPARLTGAIDRGLRLLAGRQLQHGEIAVQVGRPGAVEAEPDSTPFATAQALYSLSFVDHPRARTIVDGGLRFLAEEQEGRGLWRYWSSRHPGHRGIPPDLDDTCCVSDVLARYGADPPANRAIVLGNRDRRGRFYTWILPRLSRHTGPTHLAAALLQLPFLSRRHPFWRETEAAPGDVDGIVNANVLLYLGERPETRGAVDHLIELYGRELDRGDPPGGRPPSDKWYLDPCALAYMISRPYFHGATSLGALRRPVLERLTAAQQAGGGYRSALETALAICARLNFHLAPEPRDLELLISSQDGGGWPRAPLYYGGPRRARCWGSVELTTALCLEALTRSVVDPAGDQAPDAL